MTEKRYFSIDYDEKYYIFDSLKITEEEVLKQAEYSYDVFANSLTKDEIVNLLNEYNRLLYTHSLLHDECLDFEIKLKEAKSDIKSLNEENQQLQRSGLMAICKEQEKEIQRLKLIINGLNYALKYIKKIDVEIDLNECGDVE